MQPSFKQALAASCLAVSLGFAGAALAAGGGDDASGGHAADPSKKASEAKDDLTTCPPGQIWDKKHKKCLQRKSEVLPDAEMVEYAYSLAKADRFEEALATLDLLQNPNTARALNYRGYATRKLGRTDEGIAYYLKSIEVDPKYAQVREYLGEAYVIQGKFDLAKQQLATIGALCGATDCEYYRSLAKALDDAHAL